MVDVEPLVVVHGRDSHAVLHVFRQKTTVHHVEVKSVVELDVHVAHQCSPYTLEDIATFVKKGVIDFWIYSSGTVPILTGSSCSQASLLGANMVKDPLPSISSLSLDMSEYCWVDVAFTSPSVPYTWSMGATGRETDWLTLPDN